MSIQPVDLDTIAATLCDAFLPLTANEQQLAGEIYRALLRGDAPTVDDLASRLHSDAQRAHETLTGWPGVYFDNHQRIQGFWGLSLAEMPHLITVDGTRIYAWCAFDPPFILPVVGVTAAVESTCPVTGETIRLPSAQMGSRADACQRGHLDAHAHRSLRRERPRHLLPLRAVLRLIAGRTGVDGCTSGHLPAERQRRVRSRETGEPRRLPPAHLVAGEFGLDVGDLLPPVPDCGCEQDRIVVHREVVARRDRDLPCGREQLPPSTLEVQRVVALAEDGQQRPVMQPRLQGRLDRFQQLTGASSVAHEVVEGMSASSVPGRSQERASPDSEARRGDQGMRLVAVFRRRTASPPMSPITPWSRRWVGRQPKDCTTTSAWTNSGRRAAKSSASHRPDRGRPA